jgi:hypothetical protein
MTDKRPVEGWGTSPWGNPTFVKHDYSWLRDRPPYLEGYTPRFVGVHGVGPGSYVHWTYRARPR